MVVRIPSAVMVVVALLLAGAARGAGGSPDRSGAALRLPATPLLSPRRAPTLLVAGTRDPVLVEALDGVVADGPTTTCVTVAVDGREVYAHNPDLPVVPASNQKLVTAQLTLETLGKDFRYTTEVVGPAPDDGVVHGDLVLVGGGDPVLGTDDWIAHFADQPAVGTSLETLADRVVDAGVRRVTGSVAGDESRYDALRSVPSWPSRYLEQRQLGPLSALTVNGGLTAFPAHATEENRTDVTLADDPPLHGAEVFARLLRDRGVTVDGVPKVAEGRAADTKQLASVQSPPLADVVRHMLSESDNQVAEMFVKEIGHAEGDGGSTAAGLAVMERSVGKLGISTDKVRFRDGSGLDPETKLTCSVIYGLLSRAGEDSEIGRGLAVSGESGTLRERFGDDAKGLVKAKTGTLNEVTALSGFADSHGGPTLTFAYVANGVLVGPDLLALQDRLVDAMLDYTGGLSIAELGPR